MTDFIDLTAELTEMVIGHYVKRVGIRKAWKNRGVSETFASYIEYEVVANQDLKVYRKRGNRNLIDHILPKILKVRTKKVTAVPDYLPDIIRKIVTVLMRVNGQTSGKEREACTTQVCEEVARYANHPFWDTFNPNQRAAALSAGTDGGSEALCLAICRNDHALIQRLAQRGVSIYSGSPYFGAPAKYAGDILYFAIQNYRTGVLAALIAASGPAPDGRTRGRQKHMIDGRIKTVIEDQWSTGMRGETPEKVAELLSWYTLNPQANAHKASVGWFKDCLTRTKTADVAVQLLDIIFGLKPSQKIFDAYREKLGLYSRYIDADILQAVIPVFLREVLFDATNVNTYLGDYYPPLLDLAVRSRDAEIVDIVLHLGAHPDGSMMVSPRSRSFPLIHAMHYRIFEMVFCLLVEGADPLAGYRSYNNSEGMLDIDLPWDTEQWDMWKMALESARKEVHREYAEALKWPCSEY